MLYKEIGQFWPVGGSADRSITVNQINSDFNGKGVQFIISSKNPQNRGIVINQRDAMEIVKGICEHFDLEVTVETKTEYVVSKREE